MRRRKYRNLINLHRDPSSGGLILEIGGKPYQDGSQFSEQDRRNLEILAREWLDWLGVSDESQRRLEVLTYHPQPPAQPDATLLFQNAVSLPKAVKQPEPPLNQAAKIKEKTLNSLENPAATTMVGQIDEILQERLAGSPLEGRNIKLTEDAREGVVVWIGADRYPGIDAVPDLEVREEIKAAVSVWERRLDRNRT
ncbi:MAG: hypothetical protein HPY59_04420 [Anaerolineae bacterium]|nr:hypothetical protein [Anaerolineae bacterium]